MTDIIDRLNEHAKYGYMPNACRVAMQDAATALATARAEAEALREALAFYAQRRNWRAAGMYMCGHAPDSACAKDGGIRARAALTKGPTQ